LFSQTKYSRSVAYDGWDIYAEETSLDSIYDKPYRLDSFYNGNTIGFIQFFSANGKYQKGQEYFYNQDKTLVKIVYYSSDHRVKWTYHFSFDPIISDWKIEKRSNRGEYIGQLYLQEIEYDTTINDPGFFHGLPAQIRSY